MNKSQYIIFLSSVLVIAAIYFLPKVVVSDNESELSSSNLNMEDAHVENSAEVGNSIVSSLVVQEAFLEAKTANDSLEILSGFIDKYQSLNHYDSAAFLAESIAESSEGLNFIIAAAQAYYDAYTFAVQADRIQFLSDKARTYLSKSLDIDDSLLDLKVQLGMTYVNSSNPMQGILMIREVLETDPNNELAIFNLGVLSMQSGQFQKAITRFEKLREITEDDSQAVFYLGICYQELNQKEKAIELFKYVLDNSTNEDVKNTVKPYLDDLM